MFQTKSMESIFGGNQYVYFGQLLPSSVLTIFLIDLRDN